MNLGEFANKKKISGIFLFIHSINHITIKEIQKFKKICKDSYIIIINPNPKIGKIVGKTDDTVISYLEMNDIEKLFKAKIIFDFFYHPIMLKRKRILLREAILLKTNSWVIIFTLEDLHKFWYIFQLFFPKNDFEQFDTSFQLYIFAQIYSIKRN